MSAEAVKQVIDRAIDNQEYRNLLFTAPTTALAGYDLTADERQKLSNLNAENFDQFAGNLGDRTTKGWIPPSG